MLDSLVYLDDVLVIRETDFGLFCDIEGRPTFIGRLQLALNATVPPSGTRGTLAITRVAAQDLGLTPPSLVGHDGHGPRRTPRSGSPVKA